MKSICIILLIIQLSNQNINPKQTVHRSQSVHKRKHRLKKNDGLRKMGFEQFSKQDQIQTNKQSIEKIFDSQISLEFEEQELICKIDQIKQLEHKQCQIQLFNQKQNEIEYNQDEQYSDCQSLLQIVKEYDLKLKCGNENLKIFSFESKSINESNQLIINQVFIYPGTKNDNQNCESYMNNVYECKIQNPQQIQESELERRKLKHKKKRSNRL